MSEELKIIVVGDASELLSELRKAGVEVTGFTDKVKGAGKETDEAGKKTRNYGNEARDLAGAFGIATAGVEVLGQAISFAKDFTMESIAAARESKEAEAELAAVLESTAGAAGMSKAELEGLATALQDTSNFSDEAVMHGESILLTFTKIGRDVFPQATLAVANLAEMMGGDLQGAAQLVGKALNVPEEAASKLERVGIQLTEQQKAQIETMVRMNDIAGAQGVVLAELETQFGGQAAAAREAAGGAQDLAVAYGNLQESIGGLLLAIGDSGVTGALTGLVDKLTQGADAWTGIISQAQQLKSALGEVGAGISPTTEDFKLLGDAAVEGFAAPLKAGNTFFSELAKGTGIIGSYQKGWERVLNPIGDASAAVIRMTTDEKDLSAALDQGKAAMSAAAGVAAGSAYQSMRKLTGATYEAARAARELAGAQAAQEAASAGYAGMTNREKDALEQLYNARANQPEALDNWDNSVEEERRQAAQQTAEEQASNAEQAASDMQQAMEQAADNIKSTIESVIQPSLSEVWKPPEAAHFDEDARRLATVATSGFQSEWLAQLSQQYAGQDFFAPITQAMESGDEGALKQAAAGILENSVTNLWDPEVIKQRVREQLQQAQLRENFIKDIQEQLSAEGLEVDAGAIATASGDMSQAAGTMSESFNQVGQSATAQLDPAKKAVDDLGTALVGVQSTTVNFGDTSQTQFDRAGKGVKAYGDEVKKADWVALGKSIDQGIGKGIDENKHLVLEKLKGLAQEAVDAARDELGIHSPSSVFADLVGREIPAGAAQGVEENSDVFQKSVNKLFADVEKPTWQNILGGASDDVEKYLDHMNIETSKAEHILGILKRTFRANHKEILAADDPKALMEKLALDAANWGQAGIGNDIVAGAANELIAQFNRHKPLYEARQIEEQAKALKKLVGLENQFSSFGLAAGQEMKDQLETQLKFAQSKEEQLRLEEQVRAVEGDMASLSEQQAGAQQMQKQLARVDLAKKAGLDLDKVMAMSDSQAALLQQQLSLADTMKKNGMGRVAGLFGGSDLSSLLGNSGDMMAVMASRMAETWAGLMGMKGAGGGGAGGYHYYLNVASSMPSAGLARDFRLMASQSGSV